MGTVWAEQERQVHETSLKEGNVAQVLPMCTLISPRVKKVYRNLVLLKTERSARLLLTQHTSTYVRVL